MQVTDRRENMKRKWIRDQIEALPYIIGAGLIGVAMWVIAGGMIVFLEG